MSYMVQKRETVSHERMRSCSCTCSSALTSVSNGLVGVLTTFRVPDNSRHGLATARFAKLPVASWLKCRSLVPTSQVLLEIKNHQLGNEGEACGTWWFLYTIRVLYLQVQEILWLLRPTHHKWLQKEDDSLSIWVHIQTPHTTHWQCVQEFGFRRSWSV